MSIADIVVRAAGDDDKMAWNDFLDHQPGSSPLARYEWRTVLRASYGVKTLYMLAEQGSEIVGILAAYAVKNRFEGWRVYSVRCGLVVSAPAAASALFDHIETVCTALGGRDALLSSGWRVVAEHEPVWLKKTLQLDIVTDEEAMWRGISL